MINHVWTIVCSRAVIDRDSNNLSLQNIIDQITLGGKPARELDQIEAIPMELNVITLWERADFEVSSQGTEHLSLILPSGDTIISGENTINLSESMRFRSRAKFQNLPIKGAGRYIFRVKWRLGSKDEWQHAVDVPLWVTFKPVE
jgi:hypothetical protein